ALAFFAVLFMVVTARIVVAQAMISEVVTQEQRGSFMSVNGSVQQMGQAVASLVAGLIIYSDKSTHQLYNYNWVGYLSILILIICMLAARSIFKQIDRSS
ncbi:MAG TPA: MFS transporter, partial [Chitinophagaceae bacterium]|nr:MFS transporter [Chitinophagaceae bacterium]